MFCPFLFYFILFIIHQKNTLVFFFQFICGRFWGWNLIPAIFFFLKSSEETLVCDQSLGLPWTVQRWQRISFFRRVACRQTRQLKICPTVLLRLPLLTGSGTSQRSGLIRGSPSPPSSPSLLIKLASCQQCSAACSANPESRNLFRSIFRNSVPPMRSPMNQATEWRSWGCNFLKYAAILNGVHLEIKAMVGTSTLGWGWGLLIFLVGELFFGWFRIGSVPIFQKKKANFGNCCGVLYPLAERRTC